LSAGSKIAALYHDVEPDGMNGRWWVAVFDGVLGGEMQSLYGPVTHKPHCYQRNGSEDRFTSLIQGKLVTMTP
jgi:hypothetical protein